jgi:hypothetical protein
MQIAVISDNVSKMKQKITLEKLLTMLPAGKFLFVATQNQINKKEGVKSSVRYNRMDLERYKKRLQNRIEQTKFVALRNVLLMELEDINNGTFSGSIPVVMNNAEISGISEEIGKLSLRKIRDKVKKGLKKVSLKNVFRGAKVVGLVPVRKAFLALVTINARGLANRLAKLNTDQLNKLWSEKFGGKTSVLESAIRRGRIKRPLTGRGKRVRGVNGIGSIEVIENIGEASAAPGTPEGGFDVSKLISIAGPILNFILGLLKKNNIPEEPEVIQPGGGGDDLSFEDYSPTNNDSLNSYNNYEKQAIKTGVETGVLPEKPLTTQERELNDVIPGDDYRETQQEGSTDLKSLAPLLIGGAALAYLASK